MKLFFGINVSQDANNTAFDGEVFLSDQVEEYRKITFQKKLLELREFDMHSNLPLTLQIIKILCGIIALFYLMGVLNALFVISFTQILQKAPVLFCVAIVSLVIFLLLFIIGHKKGKKADPKQLKKQILQQYKEMMENPAKPLLVSDDAIKMDLIGLRYIHKNGELIPEPSAFYPYYNFEYQVYVENDALHLVKPYEKYTIPLSSIKEIRKISQRICVHEWHKNISPKCEEYKSQYHMKAKKVGKVFFEPYYALIISHQDETYALYFPPYELETIQSLTNIPYEE